jgi:hypothetical protein
MELLYSIWLSEQRDAARLPKAFSTRLPAVALAGRLLSAYICLSRPCAPNVARRQLHCFGRGHRLGGRRERSTRTVPRRLALRPRAQGGGR